MIFPGGKLELGENLEACARREFKEETGCHLTNKKTVGAYVSYDPDTEYEKKKSWSIIAAIQTAASRWSAKASPTSDGLPWKRSKR